MSASTTSATGNLASMPTQKIVQPETRLESLQRRIVFRMLSKVSGGQLTVKTPGGGEFVFGVIDHPRQAVVEIHENKFFARVLRSGRMAPGEGFMKGEWSADDPAVALEILARTIEKSRRSGALRIPDAMVRLRPKWRRRNNKSRARKHISAHYDMGNDLFELMLDRSMAYSCAIWPSAESTLEEAQLNKFETMCAKLELERGQRLLDIGCGWGGFAIHAAKHHGVRVVGVTLSERQHAFATERVKAEGLEHLIDIRLQDYRTLVEKFDRVASTEMLEAIGAREVNRFFKTLEKLLEDDGVACIQTIALPDQRLDAYLRTRDWIEKYIFPGGQLTSLAAIQSSLIRTGTLMIRDVQEIGAHYAPTLRAWRDRLKKNSEELSKLGYDEEFGRMMTYYLSFCEAGFSSGMLRDMQLVITRPVKG